MALLAGTTGCTSARHRSAPPASTTTLPPGAITTDVWVPPHLSGGPSQANFCTAVTAIYRHEAELPHVASTSVSADILGDYISYTPTVIAAAPPTIASSAATYMRAVADYLGELLTAKLNMRNLAAGALSPLVGTNVSTAYADLHQYVQANCHYTIGGS